MSDDSFVVSDEEMPATSRVAAITTMPAADSGSEKLDMESVHSLHEEDKEEPPPPQTETVDDAVPNADLASFVEDIEVTPIEAGPAVVADGDEGKVAKASQELKSPAVAKPQPAAKKSAVVKASKPPVAAKPSPTKSPFQPELNPSPRTYVAIPVLNAITSDSLTYDLDRMTSPRMQKKAELEQKQKLASTRASHEKSRKSEGQDFIKMNREAAGKRVPNYSCDEAALRKRASMDLHHVDERFYSYQRTVQEKVKKMEEEKMLKEQQECTFAPALVSKRRSSEGPRSADVFFQEQLRHKTYVESKVQAMKKESDKAQKVMEDSFFHPQLCGKSMEIVSAKGEPAVPAHEKLYHAHKQSMQKQMKKTDMAEGSDDDDSDDATVDSVKPFTPAINKTSLMLVRDKPIEVHLLEDAKRRADKRKSAPTITSAKPTISANSTALLLTRFKEDLSTAWEAVDETQAGELRYSSIADLLKRLKFVENNMEKEKQYEVERTLINTFWAVMRQRDDGAVSKVNVETFLLAVMNFPVKETEGKQVFEVTPEEEQAPAEDGSQCDKPREPALTFGRMEDGIFCLNPGDCKRIHLHFLPWFDSRMAFMSRQSKNPAFKEKYEPSFHPELSKNSKRMMKERLVKLAGDGFSTYEDYLLSEAYRREERLKELEAKKEREVKKECTFQPKTDAKSARLVNSLEERKKDNISGEYMQMLKEAYPNPQNRTNLLYELANISRIRRSRQTKSAHELELEKCALELTFTPDTSKTIGYSSEPNEFDLPVKGVEKAIERLARGRRVSQLISTMRETGMPNRGEWKVDPLIGEIPEEPMIVLAVQVNGRAQELRVRQGENLESTLQVFTAQHRLGGFEAEQVKEELRRQYMEATGAVIDD